MAGRSLTPEAAGAAEWQRAPERGSMFWLSVMIRISTTLGWRAGHILLFPITAYFLAFSPRQRGAARQFLGRALGRPAVWGDLWRLYFSFAACIHDRIWLAAGRTEGFSITVHGLDALRARIEVGQGCLLFGAHLGSFEALRAIADAGCPVPVSILMQEANAARVKAVFDALGGAARAEAIIPLGRPDSMLRVREALDRGGLVGLLADRAAAGQTVRRVDFLGHPAPLPTGPHLLAAVLGVPVFLAFGIRTGPRRYAVHFSEFPSAIAHDRAGRDAAIAASVEAYARQLEAMARAYPDNWFNFFPFWQEESA